MGTQRHLTSDWQVFPNDHSPLFYYKFPPISAWFDVLLPYGHITPTTQMMEIWSRFENISTLNFSVIVTRELL